jgi:PPIC-type PPIASE domain
MNSLMTIILVSVALGAGGLTGDFFSNTIALHKLAGWFFHRGHLVAIFRHRGIFERESIPDDVLQVRAAREHVNRGELMGVMLALSGQFESGQKFAIALRENGIWCWQFRQMVAGVLRGENWLEEKIAPQIHISADEARRYFDEHQSDFALPLRLRPRHIFLAAPPGSDVIEEKRSAMEQIMARLQNGEDFASLAAELSEDEASKAHGGDLGFLSNRIPPDFWNAIENLPVNGPVRLVHSHLGFHAVQIIDARAPRMMTFEEARPEIEQLLNNCKRRQAVNQADNQLAREAALVSD